MRQVVTLLLGCLLLQNCGYASEKVRVGAEVLLEEHLEELKGKRVGLVMNPTARVGEAHMLDLLLDQNVNVTALFAPEHGFRGDFGAGETIENGVDQATGLPVYSLYGVTKKPTAEMLKEVDLLLFDMQDVGARFYTYNVTMGRILEASAEHDVPVWILDRPNPAGGNFITGWMLEKQHQSFVGAFPIPMVHGMTLGELAKMMVGEGWIDGADEVNMRVVKMEGWERSMRWPQTGLEWIPPSPNLPSFKHAYLYLGTVLFEGTTLSEGRGTPNPFMNIGAPNAQLSSSHIARIRRAFSGVNAERITFRPKSMPGKALHPKHEGELCHGVQLQTTNIRAFNPVHLGVFVLELMLEVSPEQEVTNFIEKLSGIDKAELLRQLEKDSFREQWQETAKKFAQQRAEYLLYH